MKVTSIILLMLWPAPGLMAQGWRDIIPTPKQAERIGKDWALPAEAVILVPDSAKAQIGAEEINDRIRSLGGKPLRVLEEDCAPETEAELVLVLGGPDQSGYAKRLIERHRLKLTAEDPGRQGYLVRFFADDGRRVILLAGSDPQGTLYACVTFRSLLQRKQGQVVISQVNIRDWPDFKYRGYASVLFWRSCYAAVGGTEDERLAFYKQRLDWLLRHKINVIGDETYLASDLTLPSEPIPWMRQLNAYALERGICPAIYQSTCVGTEKDKDTPLFENAALLGHNLLFTWSDDALLKRRAEVLARFVEANRFAILALHPPDGGGPVDPEQWSKRSAADKARWRDDQRAEADAHVFNLFCRAARQSRPNLKVAYTVYSYVASYLDFDRQKEVWPTLTREQWEANVPRYWERFAELIPDDVHIVVWNDFPGYMDEFRRIFGQRPMYYWCDFAGRWHRQPYFVAVHRYVGTNFYDHDEDLLIAGHDRVRPNLLNQLCGCEFAWNTQAPGAAAFTGRYWDLFKDATEPEVVFRDFVERACRVVWGEEAGPHMAPLFQHNLNPALLVRTDDALGYENRCRRRRREGRPDVELTSDLLAAQVAAAEKARLGLQTVVERQFPMDDFAFRCAVYYYRRVRVLEIVAKARYHLLKAAELLAAERTEDAQRTVEAGLTLLEAELPKLAAMARETEALPHLSTDFARKMEENIYSTLLRGDTDFEQYRRELELLAKRIRDRQS